MKIIERLKRINKVFYLGLIFMATSLVVSGCSGTKITKEEFLKKAEEANQKVQKLNFSNEIKQNSNGQEVKVQNMEGNIEYNMESKKIDEAKVTIKTKGNQTVDVMHEYSVKNNKTLIETDNLKNSTSKKLKVDYTLKPDFYDLQKLLKDFVNDMEFEETGSGYILKLGEKKDALKNVLEAQYNLKMNNVNFDELEKEFTLEFDKDTFQFKKLYFKLSYDGKKGNFGLENVTLFKDHVVEK